MALSDAQTRTILALHRHGGKRHVTEIERDILKPYGFVGWRRRDRSSQNPQQTIHSLRRQGYIEGTRHIELTNKGVDRARALLS